MVLPELKQIVGALLFAAKGTVSLADIRRCLQQTAQERGGVYRDFASVTEPEIAAAVEAVKVSLIEARTGFVVQEVAGGFRLENEPSCGPWLRQFLQKGKSNRLSRPALETLAVIAYRQPCTRADIEAVRGVAVDQILRNLLDLQLIRITGRSDLPGRPWLFGTTQKFLEYFGLKDIKDLPGIEELRRLNAEKGGSPVPAAEAERTASARSGLESVSESESEAVGESGEPAVAGEPAQRSSGEEGDLTASAPAEPGGSPLGQEGEAFSYAEDSDTEGSSLTVENDAQAAARLEVDEAEQNAVDGGQSDEGGEDASAIAAQEDAAASAGEEEADGKAARES